MSYQATSWAVRQETGNSGRKCVLLVIANHADPNGVCFPGRKTLAEECECGAPTITGHVAWLADKGFLARVERRRENGSRTTDWLVLAPESKDRGEMRDASREEYPEAVADLAKSGRDSQPEAEQVRLGFSQGQVGISGGPEEAIEQATTPSLRSGVSLASSEIEDLCQLLAGEVRSNGYSVRDPLSPAWTNPMRLLLDRNRDPLTGERWTPAQVRHAILWATSDEFWRLNIRSAANLRKHFEQLVARIRSNDNATHPRYSRDPDERAAVERLVVMREQMNAIREARG